MQIYFENSTLQNINLINRAIDIYTASGDASFYRLIPEAVIRPENFEQVKEIIAWAAKNGKYLTFRSAGTSLSGQSVTDGILLDIQNKWQKFEILDKGKRVIAQPGVIGGKINKALEKYGRKLGPDPASMNSCTIGGIIANNSSGMRSGVEDNPYNSLLSLKFILPNGLFIDTSDPQVNEKLRYEAPEIVDGLKQIRQEIINNPTLKEKIERKYALKNTIGYSLNAFLDAEEPANILAKLMVGSEGTLGFITEAELRTVPLHPYTFTGLLFFPDTGAAGRSIKILKEAGASAIEILDYTSMQSVKDKPGVPEIIGDLPEGSAGVLFEFGFDDIEKMVNFINEFDYITLKFELYSEPVIADTEKEKDDIWQVRKGLLASLGALRKPGSTLIIEDTCFRIEDITDAVEALKGLFDKHGCENAGIYGHGRDGNLHFIFSQDFSTQEAVNKYAEFMNDLADLVIDRFDGSLKAEHGTGRNMAPFVKHEWGDEASEIMKRLKKLIDPENILNPGVIINDDPQVHLKNIKSFPGIDPEADPCIECGFCESVCPSRVLTLTPRKRIALQRELLRIDSQKIKNEILQDYDYYSQDTCAVDGMCALECPVGINTGEMVKNLRHLKLGRKKRQRALKLSRKFANLTAAVKFALSTGHFLNKIGGKFLIEKISKKLNKKNKSFPQWNANLGRLAHIPANNIKKAHAIYFPCCITRVMGKPQSNGNSLPATFIEITRRAGLSLAVPKEIKHHCCGMAFSSKGYREAYVRLVNNLIESAYEWTDNGELPLVLDSSSCALTLINCERDLTQDNKSKFKKKKILDSIDFVHDYLLDRLKLNPINEKIAIHPTCSSMKLGNNEKLTEICRCCATDVFLPKSAGCCGFAGDRGLLYPELPQSAAAEESAEVTESGVMQGYSSNIPCEIGMKTSTAIDYRSFIYLVERAASGK